MKTFEEYMKTAQDINGFNANVISDAIRELENVINYLSDSALVELMQEYGEEVYLMDDIDDVIGSVYPSDIPDMFPSCEFDFDDDFFIRRYCNEYESGNDAFDLTGADINDIATAFYNDDVCFDNDEMQEIVDTAKAYLQKAEQGFKTAKMIENIWNIVNGICENEDANQIEALQQALWNAYNG